MLLLNLSEKLGYELVNIMFFKVKGWITKYINQNRLIDFMSRNAEIYS